jgi:hypothetical protein
MLGGANAFIASFFWGTIGGGFAIYGKKQSSMASLFGGIAIIGCSYFFESALWMSIVCATLVVLSIWLTRAGN